MAQIWNCLVAVAICSVMVSGCAGMSSGSGAAAVVERRDGNLILRGVPEVPASVLDRLRQYQNTRSAGLRGWAGDSLVIATRFGDTTQLHRVGAPLGTREQITFFAEPVSQAYLPPAVNDRGFIYARDVGGSEFYQLFYYDWASAEHRLLTDGRSRYGAEPR